MRTTVRKAHVAICDQKDFTTRSDPGGLWGRADYCVSYFGQLPEPYRSELEEDALNGLITYVVYSYQTPIAWVSDDMWTVPRVRYSNSTAKHQGIVRAAITGAYPFSE